MPKIKSKSGLSPKAERAVCDYLSPNSNSYLNMSKSVSKYYNTTNPNSNTVIASEIKSKIDNNLVKLTEIEGLSKELRESLTPEWILSQIKQIAEDKTTKKNIRLDALTQLGKYRDLSLWRENTNITTASISKSSEELDKEFRELIK